MNRGRNRDIIFQDDDDALTFLDVIRETCERYEIEVHAYALMPNHYHLLVRSPLGNLSQAMQFLGASYTQQYNFKNRKDGGLFRGRFKSQPIKYAAYLIYVLAYIHLNPLKANLVTRLDAASAWTSHRKYMGKTIEPDWVETGFFLNQYENAKALERLILHLHRKVVPWPKGMEDGGWFRWDKCPVDVERSAGVEESDLEESETIILRICEICGTSQDRLKESIRGPKGNPERKFAVWALRHGTHMTYREIGEVLNMTTDHVAHSVRKMASSDKRMEDWKAEWNRQWNC
ncbi:MAG: transposase [Myxococcota bacterium]|nr:transposase [Myxococcota bacterium]